MIESGLDPAQLSAASYGEFHPTVRNDSEEGRRENRCIEIILVRTSRSCLATKNCSARSRRLDPAPTLTARGSPALQGAPDVQARLGLA